MRSSHIILILLLGAVVGLSIFGVLVSRSVRSEEVVGSVALARFREARAGFGDQGPMLKRDSGGNLVGVPRDPDSTGKAPDRLLVLAYKSDRKRLVRAEVPFWFVKLKGPALQLALRGTGVDLGELGVTAAELERYGPSLILEESTATGDRLLVWTQ